MIDYKLHSSPIKKRWHKQKIYPLPLKPPPLLFGNPLFYNCFNPLPFCKFYPLPFKWEMHTMQRTNKTNKQQITSTKANICTMFSFYDETAKKLKKKNEKGEPWIDFKKYLSKESYIHTNRTHIQYFIRCKYKKIPTQIGSANNAITNIKLKFKNPLMK